MSRRIRSSQALFTIDPDWKPEFVSSQKELIKPGSSLVKLGLSLNPPNQTPAPEGIYQGVLGIIELAHENLLFPPRFIIILDIDKEMRRFPFGQLELDDASPAAGVNREAIEEVGIQIHCTNENYVGAINFGNCIFHVFTKKVPASTQVILGKEQEAWGAPTAEMLDSWVSKSLITYRHARAWQLFQEKRRSQTSQTTT